MLVEVFVKNMVCDRCIKVVRNELLEEGVQVQEVELGRVLYHTDNEELDLKKLNKVLDENGFELLESSDKILVEQVKLSLIRLLEHLPIQKTGTLSNYLSEATDCDYSRLSRIFSYTENTTVEKYFIKLKNTAEQLNLKELSMGMSSDFEQAVMNGSTYLRLGTVILGERSIVN